MGLMLSHGFQSIVAPTSIVQMHWTNIMNSKRPSFLITPAALVNIKSLFSYTGAMKYDTFIKKIASDYSWYKDC